MKIFVVGGGGREHALVWRLRQSGHAVDCAPGNPGIAELAGYVGLRADDAAALSAYASGGRYDLVVVGPEAPLADGLADRLTTRGVPVFGCSAAAAEIETSKRFAKQVMDRAGVPTARWGSFDDAAEAARFIDELTAGGGGVVVKADGLAAGKGVVVAEDGASAKAAATAMLSGSLVGAAGSRVVIEERLVGREASCMAFVDGDRVWPLAACEDHKSVSDGDRGAMTGGMGAISPTPVIDDALLERVRREVLEPTARQLVAERRPFRGLLYAGVMVTSDGPKVLEFNCRFGDPETQPLMARWEGDLGEALLAVAEGRTPTFSFSPRAACCVVLAARGYPGRAETGARIDGLADAAATGALIFHAGTQRADEGLAVGGGRVLSVTALGDDAAAARTSAYAAVERIRFDGIHFRSDIGARDGAPPARRAAPSEIGERQRDAAAKPASERSNVIMASSGAKTVAILMGSANDLDVMREAKRALDDLAVGNEIRVMSAHRTPEETARFVQGARARGVGVIIAGAGGAAHLAGAVAANTTLPVIGVPIDATPLRGLDALLATVQMPAGVPVATVAVNGAQNAGLLAAEILAVSDEALAGRLDERRRSMREKVLQADAGLAAKLAESPQK